MLLPAIGFAFAVVAYLALAVLVFVSDRRRRQGRLLIAAALTSAVWAFAQAMFESGRTMPYGMLALAEAARYIGWVAFLHILAPTRIPGAMRWLVPVVLLIWVAIGGLLVSPERVLTLGGLGAALLGLVMLEQVIRNTPPDARRAMRYLTLGVGGIFAYDLFLFSQAELLRGIDANAWHARGLVNAMLVPVLIMGARKLLHVRFDVFVSRDVTFYTSALMAVGCYVLLAAGAGLLMREVGGAWGDVFQATFLAGALIVALLLVASVSIRRRARVFLSKHFYKARYDYRLEWLRFIRTLSGVSSQDLPVAAVRSVAQILNSPCGVLYRLPEGASSYVAVGVWSMDQEGEGAEGRSFQPDSRLVRFIRSRRWIIDLQERQIQPDLYDHIDIPDWLIKDQRWRLVSPIFLGDALLGFFLLANPAEDFRLTYEDRDLLNTAGQHVATLLALQDADLRLAEFSQFEAYNRLTTFVMHDLKNCAAQLQLLVNNAVRHRQNPQFVDDAFTTIAKTAERMSGLVMQLRGRGGSADIQPVDLRDAIDVAVDRCANQRPRPLVERKAPGPCIVSADPEQLNSALEHVIRNAQEASGSLGEVRVDLENLGIRAKVWIRDTGAGMDSVFIRNRLFRPFDTTKGPMGMGIGAYQARELARSIGGRVEVHSERGQGTSFCFEFPLIQKVDNS